MTIELTERPKAGEYFAGERDLFRVERIFDDRALIEDCRTGVLVDIDVAELSRLRRVEPTRPDQQRKAGRLSGTDKER